ncbi:MAG TPA: PLP-dependent aminotransferase family protein [Bacillota bacterium]|nr:PLP-dependent aminotransferase family protein [Bacillota bacterium]HPQ61397.1 PLP-dependent aminotransferase family protein [Bacillota bacterium]
MITLYLNTDGKEPLYMQLYIQIRDAILEGKIYPQEKIPSKRKLAEDLGVSVQTVENAYGQLTAEGYIYSKPKSGYYVEDVSVFFQYSKTDRVKQYEHIVIKKKNKADVAYDFSTNVVDDIEFPYENWSKEFRNVFAERILFDINGSSPSGLEYLQTEIAGYLYRYRGISANPRSIIIGSGTEYTIMLIRLLLGDNRKIGVENPGYPKLMRMYEAMGISTVPINLDENGIKIDMLTESEANLVHVTPSHQFPCGMVMPASRRSVLLKWAEIKNDRYIIEDDYDSEFRFSGAPIRAMKSLDFNDRVIYVNSFAKSLFPGLRVNYMVFPDHLAKKLESDYSYITCPVPVFVQQFLADNINTGKFEQHLARMKKIYKSKRDTLIYALSQSRLTENFGIKGEEAGLHFLLESQSEIDELKYMENAKKAGIKIKGLREFCLKKIPLASSFVMGYSKMEKTAMTSAVTALENVFCMLDPKM